MKKLRFCPVLSRISLALAALAGPAAGGPHNCVVINGNIIIEQQGNVWIIQASDLGILQCEAFDIELFEVVRFLHGGRDIPSLLEDET